jgi:Cu/Ag efflux protein CusF
MRVTLNFRDTEFVHRKDLQNLEFVDMCLFFGVSSQTSVTDFREYDASLQDTGSEAD